MYFGHFLGSKSILVLIKSFGGILVIEYDKSTITCNARTAQITIWGLNCQMWGKKKMNHQMWQKYNHVGTAQCEDEIVKCEKKIWEPPNVTKVLSYVILELHNMRMEPSNVRKEIKEPPNVTKELSHIMFELHNVKMELSNVRKKLGNHQMWQKYSHLWY